MGGKRFIKRGPPAKQQPRFFTYKGSKEMTFQEIDVNKIFVSDPDTSDKRGARYYVYYEDKLRLCISKANLHSEYGIGHSSRASDNPQDREEGKGDWTMVVGPKGVLYDRATRTFSNIEGEDAEFYAKMMEIQKRIETLVAANPPPGVDNVNFVRMIRSTRTSATDKSKESNYLRLKFAGRDDDKKKDPNAPKPSPAEVQQMLDHPVGDAGLWTSFFDERCRRIDDNFEYVMSHSKKATVHLVFTVCSVFVSSQNAASVVCRIKEFFFKKLGIHPDEFEEYVPSEAVIQKRGFEFEPPADEEPENQGGPKKRARIVYDDDEASQFGGEDNGSCGTPVSTFRARFGNKENDTDANIDEDMAASLARVEAEYNAKQAAASNAESAAAAPC